MKRTNVFRTLASAGAAAVLMVSLTACGGSPEDASSKDFCGAMEDVGKSGDNFDDTKDAVADLADVGTPEGIGDDARKGFELMVDAYDDSGDEDELKEKSDDLSDDEKKQGEEFSSYYLEECMDAPGGTTAPSDLPSDMPTEMPSDLPTELPSDLPTDIPTDLGTELPSELESMLSELPSEMPSN